MLAQYVRPDAGSSERKTVLISSHNPLDLQICGRILMLHQGRVVAVGTMNELRTPLQGIVALHITYSSRGQPELGQEANRELQQLAGVCNVWSDRFSGPGQTRRVRLLIQQDARPTGEIVDWFIGHDLPIVAMQQRDVTLQEIYESHLEAAYAV
jgi:ABC-type multidrug transport system ATPase subunit